MKQHPIETLDPVFRWLDWVIAEYGVCTQDPAPDPCAGGPKGRMLVAGVPRAGAST